MTTPKVRGLRTPKSALKALKQTIKGREDYVYQRQGTGCLYVHHDPTAGTRVPGCLIGHLLHAHGVPLEWLTARDYAEGNAADALARDLGLTVEVAAVLGEAQSEQDGGSSWAEAVKHAADSLSE